MAILSMTLKLARSNTVTVLLLPLLVNPRPSCGASASAVTPPFRCGDLTDELPGRRLQT